MMGREKQSHIERRVGGKLWRVTLQEGEGQWQGWGTMGVGGEETGTHGRSCNWSAAVSSEQPLAKNISIA